MTVISYIQAGEILTAIESGKLKAKVILDLGLVSGNIEINRKFKEVKFSDAKASFAGLIEIANDESACYLLEKNKQPQKLKMFSADTNQSYQLVPSRDAPALEISGVKMYTTQTKTPWQSTLDKIGLLQPLRGRILDTCCCLGYTAIIAAKESQVTNVFTFETDSNVLEMTDYNPWSRELYLNRKIKLTIGDISRGIEMFSTSFFSSIIHDPSPYELSPELYSLDLYKKLFRVLSPKGKLFHSLGNPEELQEDLVKDTVKLLKEAGFHNIKVNKEIPGITAQK